MISKKDKDLLVKLADLMKKEKDIDNPYALAHWMKNKGYKSHKPE